MCQSHQEKPPVQKPALQSAFYALQNNGIEKLNTSPYLTFRFHYFAMRKMHFAMRASALVVFPGGFGTFDEMFELLTLRQTGKMTKPIPIVLYDSKFWNKMVNFQHLVDSKLIKAADLNLFTMADTCLLYTSPSPRD